MNKFENWFCGSSLWRFVTERKLLPWILSGYALGDHVLEVGAGPGATTQELLRRAGRVTSLEYDPAFVAKLAERHKATRSRPSLQCWSFIICVRQRIRTKRSRNFIACCGPAECFLRLKFATVGFSAPAIFAARLFPFRRHRHSRGSRSRDSLELPSISNARRFVSAPCARQKPEIILNDIALRTSFGLQFITLASLTSPGAFSSIL